MTLTLDRQTVTDFTIFCWTPVAHLGRHVLSLDIRVNGIQTSHIHTTAEQRLSSFFIVPDFRATTQRATM